MTTGFVLIVTKTGFERKVREALDALDEVVHRWGLFGKFDVLARVEADSEVELTTMIVNNIRTIEGIVETRTLIGAVI
ncbi:MAG TPA: Lrp/AsnC ligand binding domain-containing protein [Candidatus Poseidoniales archaeon]|nr:Lrp/AsnC ligand binding domain-containing protein [Candidatus Poseidoniales archaeon]